MVNLEDCVGFPVRVWRNRCGASCGLGRKKGGGRGPHASRAILIGLDRSSGFAEVKPQGHGHTEKVPIDAVRPWVAGMAAAKERRGGR